MSSAVAAADAGADAHGADTEEESRRSLERAIGALAVIAAGAIVQVGLTLPGSLQISLAANVGLSVLGFWFTTSSMRNLGPFFIAAGLKGIDLNKRTTRRDADGNLVRPCEGVLVPESQGTVCATVYILLMSVFIPFAFATHDLKDFPEADLSEYLAAVLTIAFASFMGLMDDVLDLRWRHKIPLPFLAMLPLLLVYHAHGGETGVLVPKQLRGLLGESLHLGVFYYVFLLLLGVFSTHAINIYAGVNGLEVGQSVVIAGSVVFLNVLQLHRIPSQWQVYRDQHLHSLFLMIPFSCVSLALLRVNWFPSLAFVGDTYCYFAGMSFFVVCVVGHFSKTMVLLLIPQFLNAVYSSPQLFRFIGIPCPRHRMPAYDPKLGYVMNSYCEFVPSELPLCGRLVFLVLRKLRLAHVKPARADGVVQMSNLTLINLALYATGPCREDILCIRLLVLQALSSVVCFIVRFGVAWCAFDVVL